MTNVWMMRRIKCTHAISFRGIKRRINTIEEVGAGMEKKEVADLCTLYIPDTASTGQILRELAEGMLG